jgi:hypothetical protein
VNTDDQALVEFGFARSVGTGLASFSVNDGRHAARGRGAHRPSTRGGDVDWDRVDDSLVEHYLSEEERPIEIAATDPGRAHRLAAMGAYAAGESARVVTEWRAQAREPMGPLETQALGTALADVGDDAAVTYAEALRAWEPGEADAIVARLHLRKGDLEGATSALEAGFVRLRADPWPLRVVVARTLDLATQVAAADPRLAARLFAATREPFALRVSDERRMDAVQKIAARVPDPAACVAAFDAYGRNVPWTEPFLAARYACYRAAKDPRAEAAGDDYVALRAQRPSPFAVGGADRAPISAGPKP